MEYPKIETAFDRNKDTFKVDTTQLRLPEFDLINNWLLTEKIDGTNIRVNYSASEDGAAVSIQGRSDNAQIPVFLMDTLREMFTIRAFDNAFYDDSSISDLPLKVTLYGEGYGARIQKGGGNYRSDTSFRLFDVKVGDWWLNWSDVEDVARKMEIKTVPRLHDWGNIIKTRDELKFAIASGAGGFIDSVVAIEDSGQYGILPEGVVARTDPLLFDRRGQRVMWKLKFKDFE